MPSFSKQAAFSLLELIIVIVLLGVLAGGAGLLITKPIEAYSDQLRRQQLVDQGEMVLRQIARDVRQALPNSIRTNGTALEMVNTVDGARYRDEKGGEFTNPNDILNFLPGGETTFNLLGLFNKLSHGSLPTDQTLLPSSHRLVIYNTAPTEIYTQALELDGDGIITQSGTTLTLSLSTPATEDPEHHITMAPKFRFTQQSPGQRAFIVDGPISYICDPAARRITRYSGYAYQVVQPTSVSPPAGGSPVVTQLSACDIDYNAGTTQRGGLVTLQITLNDSTGESITLLHQIHVDNVP